MTSRGSLILLAASLAVALLLPALAEAEPGPVTLLSGEPGGQFEEALAPAISADGSDVVFQGTRAGVEGIWRRDLASGQIEEVAGQSEDPALDAPDATGPSISADGRWVAFTTTADLPAANATSSGSCPQVYLRDMDEEMTALKAYTLVSVTGAPGAEAPIAYLPGACPTVNLAEVSAPLPVAGSQAAAGVALSADGTKVAFTVSSPSDLADPSCVPVEAACLTEPSQVAVRDLATHATTILSTLPGGGVTPGGGAFPSAASEAHVPATVGPGSQDFFGDQLTASTAAISGDGEAVAWTGTDVSAQVPDAEGLGADEAEPLWRSLEGGPTVRLLGGAGLEFSYFRAELEPDEAILAGALVAPHNVFFDPPALSADGRSVALLANAPPPAAVPSAKLAPDPSSPADDAYLVELPALGAPQVTALTTTPAYDAAAAAIGAVRDLAISPDGGRVAFDSERSAITAPDLSQISPPIAFSHTFATYEADLRSHTLRRLGAAYDGSQPDGDAGTLSLDAAGTLVFASKAKNLFYGDALSTSEVYGLEELPSQGRPPTSRIDPLPPQPAPKPPRLLRISVASRRDGTVVVDAVVPGRGRLSLRAVSQLPSRRASRAGRALAARARKGGARALPSRLVASEAGRSSDGGGLRLVLSPRRPYRSLAAARGGLYAILHARFSGDGKPLGRQLPVTFRSAKGGRGR